MHSRGYENGLESITDKGSLDLMTVKCSLITGQTKLSKSQSNYFYAMVEAYNRTNDVIFSMLVPLYLPEDFFCQMLQD